MTIPVFETMRQAARDLSELKQRFAIVGGVAVGVRTEPRTTRDVDFAITVANDKEAERICADLHARGYRYAIFLEQEATGRLATARLISAADGRTHVDLLFASCGIEDVVVAAAESVAVDGVSLPVAQPGHLLAMKILSNNEQRVQDPLDIRALLLRMKPTELARARAAVKLIHERGYARDRDVAAELEAAVCRWASTSTP